VGEKQENLMLREKFEAAVNIKSIKRREEEGDKTGAWRQCK
jgi:hypothetical protein